ncbi:MAG: hypothetical protein GQ574_08105 [Crocinitomix sp.]|nr:hypothetical protein [Crocinitomix sp.]
MFFRHALLLLLISCFNQSKAQHVLTIHIEDCRKETGDMTLKFIQLYQRDSSGMKDLGLFYPSGTDCFSIPELTEGHYYFTYPNKYNKEISFNLIIEADTDTTELTICPDRHNHGEPNHIPIIMQLKQGESYTLHFGRYGCFTHWEDSIKVERMNNKYFLTHKNDKKELSTKQYEFIQRFETDLNHFERGGGCTTKAIYKLVYNGQTYAFSDESCEWGGGYTLMKNLKLKTK